MSNRANIMLNSLLASAALALTFAVGFAYLTSKTSGIPVINHSKIDLVSINNLDDLQTVRLIVSDRIKLNFNNNILDQEASVASTLSVWATAPTSASNMAMLSSWNYPVLLYGVGSTILLDYASKIFNEGTLDYVSVCRVDAKYSLAKTKIIVDQALRSVTVKLPVVVLDYGITDEELSFVWREEGKVPQHGLSIAKYELEKRAPQLAVAYNIVQSSKEQAVNYFNGFLKPLGFERVVVEFQNGYEIAKRGQSESKAYNCISYVTKRCLPLGRLAGIYPAPHLATEQSLQIMQNFERQSPDEKLVLYWDFLANRDFDTGILFTTSGLYWNNDYLLAKDSNITGFEWTAFSVFKFVVDKSKVNIVYQDGRLVGFIDLRSSQVAEDLHEFLCILQNEFTHIQDF